MAQRARISDVGGKVSLIRAYRTGVTLVLAISVINRIEKSQFYGGSMTKERFATFLHELEETVGDSPYIFVLDNAPCHRGVQIRNVQQVQVHCHSPSTGPWASLVCHRSRLFFFVLSSLDPPPRPRSSSAPSCRVSSSSGRTSTVFFS